MKHFMKEFGKRGMMFAWGGPVIYAIILFCVDQSGVDSIINLQDVVKGIVTSALLAFIAAGISVIYKDEKRPTLIMALIHAGVLYADYLLVYLLNGWIPAHAVKWFTLIFIAGYAIIWLIIYAIISRNVRKINQNLSK